jgi:hypothetical protein
MPTQNTTNERMLQPYIESAPPAGYLTRFFSVGADGMHNNEKVSIDIMSDADDVAFPTSDDGWHFNRRQGFSGKEWTPPVYKEAFAVGASDLMKGRSIGENPFVTPVLGTRAQQALNQMAIKLQNKIQNAVELQASQILTTGSLTLADDAGATRYTETFGRNSNHFAVAGTAWTTTASAVPITEIKTLCDLIRTNGRRTPRYIDMNSSTYDLLVATDQVQDAMDNQKRIWNGSLDRVQAAGSDAIGGGLTMGALRFGPYVLEIRTYDGEYKHPQTGTQTKYIPDNLYVITSGGRLQATFGGLSNFGTDGRGDRYFARLSNAGLMSDLSIVTWVTPDGTAINIGVGGRPLLIPVAINSFACGSAATS